MTPSAERRALQAAIAIGLLVSLYAGGTGVLEGPAMVKGSGGTDLDSHFRYLSGLLLGIGLAFIACIPAIERRTTVFRTLGAIVFVGGLARLLSAFELGLPSGGHRFGLMMELVVVPLIVLWQGRIARRSATAEPHTR
jgi:hypothetical protein